MLISIVFLTILRYKELVRNLFQLYLYFDVCFTMDSRFLGKVSFLSILWHFYDTLLSIYNGTIIPMFSYRCQEMFVFDKPLRIEWCSKSTRDQDLSYKRSPLYMEDDFDSHNSVNRYVRNRRLSPPSFPSGRSGSPQVSPSRTLLIGNLDSDVSASELRRVFSRYGHLIDLDIKLNRFTKCAYAQVIPSLPIGNYVDDTYMFAGEVFPQQGCYFRKRSDEQQTRGRFSALYNI